MMNIFGRPNLLALRMQQSREQLAQMPREFPDHICADPRREHIMDDMRRFNELNNRGRKIVYKGGLK